MTSSRFFCKSSDCLNLAPSLCRVPAGSGEQTRLATSTARKQAKQDSLAQATTTALAGNNRLASQRFEKNATTPQREKKSKREGSQPNIETKNNTQGGGAGERKTIETIESTPGSTALPNLSLLQETAASDKPDSLLCSAVQGQGCSGHHSLPAALPHPRLALPGSSGTNMPGAGSHCRKDKKLGGDTGLHTNTCYQIYWPLRLTRPLSRLITSFTGKSPRCFLGWLFAVELGQVTLLLPPQHSLFPCSTARHSTCQLLLSWKDPKSITATSLLKGVTGKEESTNQKGLVFSAASL